MRTVERKANADKHLHQNKYCGSKSKYFGTNNVVAISQPHERLQKLRPIKTVPKLKPSTKAIL